VQQEAEPVGVEVAESVSDTLDFLISRLVASVGPFETPPVSK
jgi:hypothetical protein